MKEEDNEKLRSERREERRGKKCREINVSALLCHLKRRSSHFRRDMRADKPAILVVQSMRQHAYNRQPFELWLSFKSLNEIWKL